MDLCYFLPLKKKNGFCKPSKEPRFKISLSFFQQSFLSYS
uniref:Macaca fascicularis brain cDNA clone: QflA-21981, similar to human hypothetical protein FLJ90709 (FLJ90709), mRNA, RefSeq: NM_173514.1 n=1 Tax=Macaca fascicularis TaxID=9541 RepID=I7GDD0_MACFA|nr:unnamed protein product [Macaca fascicularis]